MAFGVKNLGVWGGNLTESNVSTKGWLVDISPGWGSSGLLGKLENQYVSIKERILARATASQLTGTTLTGSGLNSAITTAIGAGNKRNFPDYEFGGAFDVAILEIKGPVTLGTPADPVDLQTRKAVLLVDQPVDPADPNSLLPGVVTIHSSILRDDTGNPVTSGFLAIIAQDDIVLGDDVAVTPTPATSPYQEDIASSTFTPHISAVFYSQGSFRVNGSWSQLKIDGAVVAMGGVILGRTNEGPYPAEFVHYNPGMIRILRDVGLRRKIVMEAVP
jgi:hypothetical protein